MKKSKFSEEQIVRILKEVEAGAKGHGDLPQVQDLRADLLQLEAEVRRHGGVATASAEGARARVLAAEEDVCGLGP